MAECNIFQGLICEIINHKTEKMGSLHELDRSMVVLLAKCMQHPYFDDACYYLQNQEYRPVLASIADGTFDWDAARVAEHIKAETNKFDRGVLRTTTDETIQNPVLKDQKHIMIHGTRYRILKHSYVYGGLFVSMQRGHHFVVDLETGRRQQLPARLCCYDISRHKNICKLESYLPKVVLDFSNQRIFLHDHDPEWDEEVVILGPDMHPQPEVNVIRLTHGAIPGRPSMNGLVLEIQDREYWLRVSGVPGLIEINKNIACWFEEGIDQKERKKMSCDLLELDKKRVNLLEELLPIEDLRMHLLPYMAPSILF
jgi:hypothetical protein